MAESGSDSAIQRVSSRKNDSASEQPKKRLKTKTVDQKYKEDYHKQFPFIVKSSKSASHALCTVCNVHISVAHGGVHDVKMHTSRTSHEAMAKSTASNKSISSMFATSNSVDNVTKAEILFTNFLVEHNLPIAAADHAAQLFKGMFPDSAIAAKYACARTKTCAILEVLADDDSDAIANILRNNPFSLATDGSTDYDAVKLYPLVVRYYEPDVQQIVCVLLVLKELKGDSTGENIYNLLNSELTSRGIPWSNCISFGMDNASVMSGMNKGVAGFLSRTQSSIYMSGCMCHLMHLAAQKGGNQLQKNCKTTVEDALIIMYYYLDKSSNRKRHLQDLQQEHGTKPHKIMKLVNTRWLSLNQCLKRMVEQWEPLREFFKSEKNKTLSKSTKSNKPSSSSTKCDRPGSSSTKSDKPGSYSTKSDKSGSSSTKSGSSSTKSDKSGSSSTKSGSSITKSDKSGSSNTKSDKPSSSNTKSDSFDLNSYLFTQQKLQDKKEIERERKMKLDQKRKEYESVPLKLQRISAFLDDPTSKLYCLFLTAVLPLFEEGNLLLQQEEPVVHLVHSILTKQLQNLLIRFIKPGVIGSNKDSLSCIGMCRDNQVDDERLFIGSAAKSHIADHNGMTHLDTFYAGVRKFYVTSSQYMCDKFPYEDELLIRAKVLHVEMRQEAEYEDLLYFVDRFPYLLGDDVDLRDRLEGQFLNYVVEDLLVTTNERVDTTWSIIGGMKDVNGQLKYNILARVMLGIATIFHSNADCERLFSYVTKNKTEFRSNISTRTLSCLVTRKVRMRAMGTPCYKTNPRKDILRKAKSACYNKLMQ